jgi:hypothetical protein
MQVFPQGIIDIEKICVSELTSDHGTWVNLTEWNYIFQNDPNYDYVKSTQGVFKRSVNYWDGSPYGWQQVLPRHLDQWGFQL